MSPVATGPGMSVNVLSEFSKVLRETIKENRPKNIIETGTYLGKGSTTVIASSIRDFKLDPVRFYSIEVNPNFFRKAYIHLKDQELLNFVYLVHGLSVRKDQLLSKDEIQKKFVDMDWPKEIYVDHDKDSRTFKYFEETNFDYVPDGMLLDCLKKLNGQVDFVLLDSAGHMGEIEFDVLIEALRGECIIALDDVYHVKHYRSLQKIKKDKRFEILNLSKEKFGFCVTKFIPEESFGEKG